MADTKRALEVVLEFRDKLSGGLRSALGMLGKFGSAVRSAFGFAASKVFSLQGAILGLIGGGTAAGIAGAVKSVAGLGDELLALSQKTGLTVEAVSRLKFAAEQSNTDIETLAQALVKFQVNLGEFARTGRGEAAQAIELLGQDFQDAARQGAPVGELLRILSARFEGLESQADKLTVAVKLFGRGGAALLPLLSEGEKGIIRLMEQSDELGKTWSEKDARAADDFGDAMGRLKAAATGTLEQAIKPLLPALREFIDMLTGWVQGHQAEVLEFFDGFLAGVQRLVPAIETAAQKIAAAFVAIIQPIVDVRRALLRAELEGLSKDILALQKSFGEAEDLARQSEANRQFQDAKNYRDRKVRRGGQLSEAFTRQSQLQEELNFLDGVGRAPILGGPGDALSGARNSLREAIEAARKRQSYEVIGPPLPPSGPDIFGSRGPAATPTPARPGGWAGVKDALYEIREAGTDTFKQLKGATLDATDAVVDGLASGIAKASQNWRDFGEIARQTGQLILQSLQQIIIKLTLMRIIGGALDYFGIGEQAPAATPRNARGTPFTRGGEIAGEAGPEAVIPLPGNRHVPVQLVGGGRGGGGDTYVFISAVDAKSFDEQLRAGAARQRRFLGGLQAAQYGRSPGLRSKYL